MGKVVSCFSPCRTFPPFLFQFPIPGLIHRLHNVPTIATKVQTNSLPLSPSSAASRSRRHEHSPLPEVQRRLHRRPLSRARFHRCRCHQHDCRPSTKRSGYTDYKLSHWMSERTGNVALKTGARFGRYLGRGDASSRNGTEEGEELNGSWKPDLRISDRRRRPETALAVSREGDRQITSAKLSVCVQLGNVECSLFIPAGASVRV